MSVEFRPVSEIRVRVEDRSLVVEHEGHSMRFRAQPVIRGSEVSFCLTAERLEEMSYFASTFGGCGWTESGEWVIYNPPKPYGRGEKLTVKCVWDTDLTQIRDPAGIPVGYAVVYRPRLVAVLERPLSEGVTERLVAEGSG